MKLKGPFLTLVYHAHTLLIFSFLSGFGSSNFGVVATGPSHEARWIPHALEHHQAGTAAHRRRALNRRVPGAGDPNQPSWRRSSGAAPGTEGKPWRRSSKVTLRDFYIKDGEEDLEERQAGNELSVIRERRLKGIISDIVHSEMDKDIAPWYV
jgi:hypothetical protein